MGALQAIAEFNVGKISVYFLRGAYPRERFVRWQRVEALGVGAAATLAIDGALYLLAASYHHRALGSWQTRSPVLRLDGPARFEPHHESLPSTDRALLVCRKQETNDDAPRARDDPERHFF